MDRLKNVRVIAVSLPKDLVDRLEKARGDINRSRFVEKALLNYLESYKERKNCPK